MKELLTKLSKLLSVSLVRNDTLAVGLGLGDCLFEGGEPSVALRCCLGLEGVLVSVELEEESNGSVLAQVGGISL